MVKNRYHNDFSPHIYLSFSICKMSLLNILLLPFVCKYLLINQTKYLQEKVIIQKLNG